MGDRASAQTLREKRCETCAAWNHLKKDKGECRRHAPMDNGMANRAWRKTKSWDWCMEWIIEAEKGAER